MFLAGLLSLVCCRVGSAREIVLVVDSSASMNGLTSDRVRRIDAAKDAFAKVMPYLSEHQVGLVMFGHRTAANSEGCCNDIEGVVPIGPFSPAVFTQAVMAMQPTGNTPLAKSLETTRDMLLTRTKDVSKEVIVLTDGNDTCNGNPQQIAAQMSQMGINVRIHVVGFSIKPEEENQLRRIAQACGGTYHTANSAAALGKALKEVIEIAPPTGPVALTAVEKALVARLQDKNPNVRITAATALKKRNAVAAVPMLIQRVQDDVYSLGYGKNAALDAIQTMAPEQVTGALIGALDSESVHLRSWACAKLQEVGGPISGARLNAVDQALVDRLTDANPNVRIAAARALHHRKVVAAVPFLIRRMTDNVYSLGYGKNAALAAVQELAAEKVEATLLSAMESNNDYVRDWATSKLIGE